MYSRRPPSHLAVRIPATFEPQRPRRRPLEPPLAQVRRSSSIREEALDDLRLVFAWVGMSVDCDASTDLSKILALSSESGPSTVEISESAILREVSYCSPNPLQIGLGEVEQGCISNWLAARIIGVAADHRYPE